MLKTTKDRIKNCRISLNLNENYVSKFLGISVDKLKKIEAGQLIPTDDQLEKMALLYGCDKDYFTVEIPKSDKVVLARNGHNLTEKDQMQILELLAFQEEISKMNRYDG